MTDTSQTFLTGPQVQARYQKSHVTIWRWIRDPDLGFPAPMQINRLEQIPIILARIRQR